MSYLMYRTNLTGWFVGDSIFGAGDGGRALRDLSGNGNHLSPNTSAFGSETNNAINGRTVLTGTTASNNFRYGREGTDLIGPSAASVFAVVKVDVVDASIAGFNNDSIWSVTVGSTTVGGLALMVRSAGGNNLLTGINSTTTGGLTSAQVQFPLNEWGIAVLTHGTSLSVGWNDFASMATAVTGATTALQAVGSSFVIGEGAFGAGNALRGSIAEILVYNQNLATTGTNFQQVMDYLRAKYFSPNSTWNTFMGHGDALEQARDVASRRLWYTRAPLPTITVEAPLRLLDAELLDGVGIAGPVFPSRNDDAGGWPNSRWGRGHARLYGRTLDLDTLTLTAELVDLRGIAHTYQESGLAIRAADPQRQGIMVSGRAPVRSFFRTSAAWIQDPSSLAIVRKTADVEKVDARGFLLENSVTNKLFRSSYVSGVTGLTFSPTSGSWPTGGSIVLDTAPSIGLLFDTVVTANSLMFTGANTPTSTSSVMVQHNAITFTAKSTGGIPAATFSLDHYDDSGFALKYTWRRAVDLMYWNEATSAFASLTPIYNTITAATTGIGRFQTTFTALTTTTTYTLAYGIGTSGGANQINHTFHAQVEQFGVTDTDDPIDPYFATSRVVTNTTQVTRGVDVLHIYDDNGLGILAPTAFTFMFKYEPLYSSSQVRCVQSGFHIGAGSSGAGTTIVVFASGDSTPMYLQYNAVTSSLELKIATGAYLIGAGTIWCASIPWTPSRGTQYSIACRMTSFSEGELGLSGQTLSIFIDGVKGTDVVASSSAALSAYTQPFFLSNEINRLIGEHEGQINTPSGYLQSLFCSPYALTDEEILEWSLH